MLSKEKEGRLDSSSERKKGLQNGTVSVMTKKFRKAISNASSTSIAKDLFFSRVGPKKVVLLHKLQNACIFKSLFENFAGPVKIDCF